MTIRLSQVLYRTHYAKNVQKWNFFWSVFSLIWAENGDLRIESLYSVLIWENTDQIKLCIWTTLPLGLWGKQRTHEDNMIELSYETSQRLSAVNYFRKKWPSQTFLMVLNEHLQLLLWRFQNFLGNRQVESGKKNRFHTLPWLFTWILSNSRKTYGLQL